MSQNTDRISYNIIMIFGFINKLAIALLYTAVISFSIYSFSNTPISFQELSKAEQEIVTKVNKEGFPKFLELAKTNKFTVKSMRYIMNSKQINTMLINMNNQDFVKLSSAITSKGSEFDENVLIEIFKTSEGRNLLIHRIRFGPYSGNMFREYYIRKKILPEQFWREIPNHPEMIDLLLTNKYATTTKTTNQRNTITMTFSYSILDDMIEKRIMPEIGFAALLETKKGRELLLESPIFPPFHGKSRLKYYGKANFRSHVLMLKFHLSATTGLAFNRLPKHIKYNYKNGTPEIVELLSKGDPRLNKKIFNDIRGSYNDLYVYQLLNIKLSGYPGAKNLLEVLLLNSTDPISEINFLDDLFPNNFFASLVYEKPNILNILYEKLGDKEFKKLLNKFSINLNELFISAIHNGNDLSGLKNLYKFINKSTIFKLTSSQDGHEISTNMLRAATNVLSKKEIENMLSGAKKLQIYEPYNQKKMLSAYNSLTLLQNAIGTKALKKTLLEEDNSLNISHLILTQLEENPGTPLVDQSKLFSLLNIVIGQENLLQNLNKKNKEGKSIFELLISRQLNKNDGRAIKHLKLLVQIFGIQQVQKLLNSEHITTKDLNTGVKSSIEKNKFNSKDLDFLLKVFGQIKTKEILTGNIELVISNLANTDPTDSSLLDSLKAVYGTQKLSERLIKNCYSDSDNCVLDKLITNKINVKILLNIESIIGIINLDKYLVKHKNKFNSSTNPELLNFLNLTYFSTGNKKNEFINTNESSIDLALALAIIKDQNHQETSKVQNKESNTHLKALLADPIFEKRFINLYFNDWDLITSKNSSQSAFNDIILNIFSKNTKDPELQKEFITLFINSFVLNKSKNASQHINLFFANESTLDIFLKLSSDYIASDENSLSSKESLIYLIINKWKKSFSPLREQIFKKLKNHLMKDDILNKKIKSLTMDLNNSKDQKNSDSIYQRDTMKELELLRNLHKFLTKLRTTKYADLILSPFISPLGKGEIIETPKNSNGHSF